MTQHQPYTLDHLFQWIQEETGLHITKINQHPVLLALKVFATESRMGTEEYIHQLIHGTIKIQPFIDAITTHESFFLRHKRSMKIAIQHIILPLIKKGVRPRILSAPCAQGEEPYSLVMLLQEHGIAPSQVEITAVDIAASSIHQAQQGRYRKYALRQVPEHFIRSHFTQQNDLYCVLPEVRNSVKFTQINLLTQAQIHLAPGFHLIFSHNMMIYFDQPTNEKMVKIFKSLLHDDGHLFVDSVESSIVSPLMAAAEFGGMRVFRKQAPKTPATSITTAYQHTTQAAPQTTPSNRKPQRATATPVAANNRGNRSEETRRSAERAYQNKQFSEAAKLYDQLIDQHPIWTCWARVGKAKVLIDSGDEMEALEEAEKALSGKEMSAGIYLSNEDMADAHAIIAMVLNNRGLKTAKLDHLNHVRKLNPNHPILKITQ